MKPPLLRFVPTAMLVLILAAEAHAGRPQAPVDAEGPCVVLQPFVVKGEPITCFGISLALVVDPNTQLISRVFVLKVTPDSEASAKGLKPGTEILAADDRDIREFPAQFDPGSEFNRLFMNRKTGARISLTVMSVKGGRPREVELTQGLRADDCRPWMREEFR